MAPPTTTTAVKRKKSSGGGNKPAADFKRIKAKVGKRAIKPANVTDTSFQAASIHVRTQAVEVTSSTSAAAAAADGGGALLLTSSRGKTLQELASQLQHPAPNVRLSAAKGLYDAVVTVSTNNNNNSTAATATAAHAVIQAHLVILIPAIGQCLLDETDAVRRLGLNILQHVLRTLSSSQNHQPNKDSDKNRSSASTSSTASTTTTATTRALRPFGNLLLAFLSSCLNSLDRDVRKDGAMAIAAVARAAPALVAPHAANSLLPAIVRLFEDAVFVRTTSSSSVNGVKSSGNNKNTSSEKGGGQKKAPGVVGKQQRQSKNKSSSSLLNSTSKSSQSSSTWHFLLQCLLAVLQTLDAEKMDYARNTNNNHASGMFGGGGEPDWIFESGGQAKNALLIVPGPQGTATQRCLYPMRSLPDVALALNTLYSSSSSSTSANANATTKATTMTLSEKTARQLLEKLRDVFIELTDYNIHMTNNAANLDSFLLLSKCLRLLVEQLSTISDLTAEESSRRVTMQLNGYIMEMFPLVAVSNDTSSSNNNNNTTAAVVNEINGQLCLTLMSMSAVIQANDEKMANMWQGKVFDYIQSSLIELDLTTASTGSGSSSSSSKHVLDGFRRLFYYCHHATSSGTTSSCSRDDDQSLLAGKQTKLIKAFAKSFFANSSSRLNLEAARSFTGRQAVGLTGMIFRTHNFELHRLQAVLGKSKEDKDVTSTRIVRGLVDYLIAFRGDYPMESEAVLRLLHAIMIRVSNDDTNKNTGNAKEESQELCTDLRQRLEPIFTSSNAPIEKATSSSCIFERYPEHVQRLMIGLVLTLGSPSRTTLSALARVCGRANSTGVESSAAVAEAAPPRQPTVISADVAAFVFHSMYSIRQNLAMADFVTFLLDGMGIIQVDDTALFVATTTVYSTTNNCGSNTQEDTGQNDAFQNMARLVQFDRGVKDASFCLVGCGSQRVLSMLHPLLSLWLAEPAKELTRKTSTRTTVKHQKELLQTRTALALMAMFSWDMNANSSYSTPIFDCLPAESESTVAKSIVRLLQYTPTETATEHEYMILHSWTSPIISFIVSEPVLLSRLFQCIADDLSTTMEGPARPQQQQQKTMMVLQSLLWLCKKSQIVELLQCPSNQNLLQYTTSMEKAVAGGPLERLVGRIIGTVELHSQQSQQPPSQQQK
jgi:pre-rRNA-processing protein IPI1